MHSRVSSLSLPVLLYLLMAYPPATSSASSRPRDWTGSIAVVAARLGNTGSSRMSPSSGALTKGEGRMSPRMLQSQDVSLTCSQDASFSRNFRPGQ